MKKWNPIGRGQSEWIVKNCRIEHRFGGLNPSWGGSGGVWREYVANPLTNSPRVFVTVNVPSQRRLVSTDFDSVADAIAWCDSLSGLWWLTECPRGKNRIIVG